MPIRSREERLRLFDVHVRDLLTESAAQANWSVRVDLMAGTVETDEPHREALRSYLVAIRILDAPKEDLFLPRLMDDLEAMPIANATREMVTLCRRRWTEAQSTLGVVIEDVQGQITPRVAFELLAYTHHLHRNAANEARVQTMPPEFWQFVRQEGITYAGTIAKIAVYLRSIARDDAASSHLFEPASS